MDNQSIVEIVQRLEDDVKELKAKINEQERERRNMANKIIFALGSGLLGVCIWLFNQIIPNLPLGK